VLARATTRSSRQGRTALAVGAVACIVLAIVGTGLVILRGPADDTVLSVDGWTLSRDELRDELDQIAGNAGYRAARARNGQPLAVFREGSTTEYDPALIVELLNERVTFRLAAQEVARRGLVPTDDDRAAALAVIEDGLAPGAVTDRTVTPGSTPGTASGRGVLDAFGSYGDVLLTGVINLQLLQRALGLGTGIALDDAAKVLYDRTKADQALQSCARHVLVRAGAAGTPGAPGPTEAELAQALDRATALRARISQGEELVAVAATESDDASSRARGGDIGCAPQGRYDGAFEEAMWNQAVGEAGGPVRSTLGYHVVQVYERRERTFEEMLPSLRAAVRDQGQAALQAWMRDATRRADVAVDRGLGRWDAGTGLIALPEGAATVSLVPDSGPPSSGAPR
jgi:hypothetical protein